MIGLVEGEEAGRHTVLAHEAGRQLVQVIQGPVHIEEGPVSLADDLTKIIHVVGDGCLYRAIEQIR